MIDLGRHPVLGVRVSAVDIDAAVDAVARAATDRQPLSVSCSAVHSVMVGALDPEHRRRLNSLDLVLPDGQPVRWGLRWRHGIDLPDRVRGFDFTLALCERAAAARLPVFFYGSRQETLDLLVTSMRRKCPGLLVAGVKPSAFRAVSDEEQRAIAAEIRASGAALVFAGLGCPRQEIWAYENRELLQMPIVAVGAAFDMHAGFVPAAPEWMMRSGLEWLYRLFQEPRRLWRRYMFLNPLYLLFLALEKVGMARFDNGSISEPRPVRVA